MKLKIDHENDALYFRLDDSVIESSEEVRPGLIIDYDCDNNVVGVEILGLKKRVREESLKNLSFETV